MLIVAETVIVIGMGLIGWMILGHFGWVPAPHWHGQAAWQTLWSGHVAAEAPSGPRIRPSPAGVGGTVPGVGFPAFPWLTILISLILIGGLLWILWGTVIWLYNTPTAARRGDIWQDWIVWRWPVITAAQISGHPEWISEAWRRHKQGWNRMPTAHPADELMQQAAQVLDTGFATSHPEAVFMPGPDELQVRRVVIVADAHGIHPQWVTGLHAQTMMEWSKWAGQWAEIALHHAGIPGQWPVDAEGVVRPQPMHKASDTPSSVPVIANTVSPQNNTGLSPETQWGRGGLPWSALAPAAPHPLPALSAPLSQNRIEEVTQALTRLGLPGVAAVRGLRGLAVDVVFIQPPPAMAKRILSEGKALAGQLGHGNRPLRLMYVTGEAGVIAVERPRPDDRQFVDLVTALARTDSHTRQTLKKMALPLCCGVTPDGTVIWSDAAKWPHLLAGGTTGGGKTIALTSWLASLMITTPPDRLRITIVDLKAGSQFLWTQHSLHVDAILTMPQQVCDLAAQWADEADARYEAFAQGGVLDLAEALAQGWTQYPYRLLVIDEYKDLRDQLEGDDKDSLKDFDRNMGRLGQKARGAGLFLWITTQHPLATTISNSFKPNLQARLALKVSALSDSRVILDQSGAENLLGQGDALFRDSHIALTRLQTPMIDDRIQEMIRQGWQATHSSNRSMTPT